MRGTGQAEVAEASGNAIDGSKTRGLEGEEKRHGRVDYEFVAHGRHPRGRCRPWRNSSGLMRRRAICCWLVDRWNWVVRIAGGS